MKDLQHIIAQVTPTDAIGILQALAASDEALAARIAEMALAHLQQVDIEDVAVTLYDELEALEVEEVWDRAGRTRHGYVEPSEAADQMIEAILAPFLEDLARYQNLGLRTQANRVGEGLLLGLYRFQHESTSEFKNWAPAAPIIFAETVVDAWKAGSPTKNDHKAIRAFITEELGGWGAHLL